MYVFEYVGPYLHEPNVPTDNQTHGEREQIIVLDFIFGVCGYLSKGFCQSMSLANAHCTVISVCGCLRGSRNAAVKLCCSRGTSDDVRCFHI